MKNNVNMSFEDAAASSTPTIRDLILAKPIFDDDNNIIDPWDPDLTKSQIVKIMKTCYENIWYFLRYVVKVKELDESNWSYRRLNFHLNDATIAFIWLYQHNQSAILLGTRQVVHKTTTLDALYLYQFMFGNFKEIPVYLPVPYEKGIPFLKNIEVPSYMIEPNMRLEQFAIRNVEICIKPDDEYVYFIDYFMHRKIQPTRHMDIIRNMQNRYYAVDSIGPENADIIRYSIPFSNDMYSKDIETFGEEFLHFTGYRPSYLITFGTNDFKCPRDLDRMLNRRVLGCMSEEAYREDFAITPQWRM